MKFCHLQNFIIFFKDAPPQDFFKRQFLLDRHYRTTLSEDDIRDLSVPINNQLAIAMRDRETKHGGLTGNVKLQLTEHVRHLITHTAKSFELIERLKNDMQNGHPSNTLSIMHVLAVATKYSLLNMAKNFDIDDKEFETLKRTIRYKITFPQYSVSKDVLNLEQPSMERTDIIKEANRHDLTHLTWYDISMFYKAMHWSTLTANTISNSDLNHTVLCFLHDDLTNLNEYYNKLRKDPASVGVRGKYHDLCESLLHWQQKGWTISLGDDAVKKGDKMLVAIWTSMYDHVKEKNDKVASDFELMIEDEVVSTTISSTYPLSDMSDSDVDAKIRARKNNNASNQDDMDGSSVSSDDSNDPEFEEGQNQDDDDETPTSNKRKRNANAKKVKKAKTNTG